MKKVLADKYRPKTLEDIILVPRIRKRFVGGLTQNYLFYGGYGSGKTSLARILIGIYSKKTPCLELNSSFYTSINDLRTIVDEFCSNTYMGIDLSDDAPMDTSVKYVFLDEVERTSPEYQDGLKAYIEKNTEKNVRFIITTNHINKVSKGLQSRFIKVNFDCQDSDEEKYLKTEIAKKILNKICPEQNFEIGRDVVVDLVNKHFPDNREILNYLEDYMLIGELEEKSSNVSQKLKIDLYNIIYDDSLTYEDIYHFLMNNFGAERIDIVIKLFGSDFVKWSLNERRENIDKLFKVAYIVSDYSSKLETSTDPLILGMTIIGKIRDIF